VSIAEFESRLDEELGRLKAELESWTYKPSPVRRVEIPKPGGRGTRKLGVPTVRDRVVQATLKQLRYLQNSASKRVSAEFSWKQ
jgi:RNA-directed DNA polymerase